MDENISIQISDSFPTLINPEIIRHAAKQALNHAAVSGQVSLTIVFEEDEKLRQLNNQYLGIDAPTDVLAFPADYLDQETGIRYLGDILISVPQALEQSTTGNHPLEEELQLLVVHGVLHLLGHDHLENGEKLQMQTAQSTILSELGSDLRITL